MKPPLTVMLLAAAAVLTENIEGGYSVASCDPHVEMCRPDIMLPPDTGPEYLLGDSVMVGTPSITVAGSTTASLGMMKAAPWMISGLSSASR